MTTRRRIAVYGLGGTIAMTPGADGTATPGLGVPALVAAVPGLDALGVDLDVVDLRNVPSASLSFDDLIELAAAIRSSSADGIVITQGTDTLEECAYLLDLIARDDRPVVVTGAMRHAASAGADGPANLLAAIRVASDPAAAGLGCLVVVNDEIHAASRVGKTHSTSTATFASPNGGPLGYVIEGRAVIVNSIRHPYDIQGFVAMRRPRIGLYVASLGDDGAALTPFAAALDGLVIAGFGVGHVPHAWVESLTGIAARIPVVLASRTGAGPVLTGTYGYVGAERDLRGRGLVPAGLLDAVKARILLYALLATGRTDIAAAFAAATGVTPVDALQ